MSIESMSQVSYPTADDLLALAERLPITIQERRGYFDFQNPDVPDDGCQVCAITAFWLLSGNAGMTETERLTELARVDGLLTRIHRAGVHNQLSSAEIDEASRVQDEYTGKGMAEKLAALGYAPIFVVGLETGFEDTTQPWHGNIIRLSDAEIALFDQGYAVGEALRRKVQAIRWKANGTDE